MILNVYVTPNTSTESIVKLDENTYQIRVKEPAEKDRANKRIINLLAKELSVPALSIRIKNASSRKKIVEVNVPKK